MWPSCRRGKDYTLTTWPITTRCTYPAIAVPIPLFLKQEGVRARVLDELMGHKSRRVGQPTAALGGAAMARRYRHTTDEMRARVAAPIETRIDVTPEVAGKLLENPGSGQRRRGSSNRGSGSDQRG
jgi:hypothetical protein